MKKTLFTLIIALSMSASFAQVPGGTWSIPGDYATFAAAVTALNAGLSGNVTFIVDDDYTETAPFNGLVMGSTALNAASVNYTITFQRSGAGTNPPKITAFTGSTNTTTDGIWKIAGTDNVTIDGIDLAENAANGTQQARMEWGYALVKLNNAAPFDGCQNVIIKNCSITLNKYLTASTWTSCYGIYSGNHIATATTNLGLATGGTTNDVMNNCKFFGNTITNVTGGINLNGWSGAPAPFNMFDNNTEIGVESPNTVNNFSQYGIWIRYAKNLLIANNNLSAITDRPASTIYGIYTQIIAGSDVYYNTVTIQPPVANPSNNAITGMNLSIALDLGFSGNVYNNTVQNCTNPGATSAAFIGISCSGVAATLNFHDNIVTNNVIPGTGSFTGMDVAGVNINMYSNTVSSNQKTGTANATSVFNCMRANGTGINNVYNNLIYSNYNQTNTGFSVGTVHGISLTNASMQTGNIYKNRIYDLLATGNSANTIVNGINIGNGVNMNVYNNFISDLRSPAGSGTITTMINSIAGINISSTSASTLANVYFNTIYLNATSTGNYFYISAINAHTNPTLDLRDNILVNASSTISPSGVICAMRRTSTTLGTYSALSNANVYYVLNEASGTLNVTYADGTNFSTFPEFQTLVGPTRDAGSFNELPPFVNVAAKPYNLHLQTTTATNCESGGVQISSPIAITTDFDGDTRSPLPDIGADEFAGIPLASVLNPSGVNTTLISSSQINVAFAPNASNNNVVIVWNYSGAFTVPSGAPPSNIGDPFAGGYLLFNGLTSPVNHTGLLGATTHYYKAFSYNGSAYSLGVAVNSTTNIAPPSNFTATTISDSQIGLAWTKNAFNSDVFIVRNTTGTGSFVQPTNGTVYPVGNTSLGGTVVYSGPANAFNDSGLSGYTMYYYKIWSYEPANNNIYSPTGVTASAQTLCSASPIPFAEGFEWGGALGCGSILNANNDATIWAVYYGIPQAHSGSYSIRITPNTVASNDDWYFTNALQLTAGVAYEVKFWNRHATGVVPHQLEVKWGNAPTVAGMTSSPIYYNTNVINNVYNQVTCASFIPSVSGNYYVGFHNFSLQSPAALPYLYIDDISVTTVTIPTDITWTGALSSEWFASGNWNPAGVPGAITNVTIPAGLTNYPTISTAANCNNIILASGASLLGNGYLTVSGTSTVNRDYSGGEWHLISSPISNATANMFLDLYLQNHTEATNLYTDITNPLTPLNLMQGYALWNNLAGTATFVGPLNTDNIGAANNVTRNGQGWNLVGNPYCSPIDWDAATGWTKTNVDNATYRHVNNATWASYVGGVSQNGGSRYIPSCQGFFVGVTSGFTVGTLNMTNAVRTHNTSTFYKDEVSDIVRLEVSGNGYKDETVIRFLDAASPEFDGQWDAHKLFGIVDEAPAIYSVENGMMAINSLPVTNTVPVGVKAGVPGEFTITATETSEFSDVILEDLMTSTFTDLKNNSYTLNYNMNFDNRFIVHFTPMAVSENPADLIKIYSSQKDVYVSVPFNTTGNIMVYNLMGQEVARKAICGTLNKITLEKSAYYVVKVLNDESVVSEKVFVK
jgi:hypothetical protein